MIFTGEVLRVGEEDRPGITHPVVKADPALGGVRLDLVGTITREDVLSMAEEE
jgi:hypothetical protein